jgi:hypothetical protein
MNDSEAADLEQRALRRWRAALESVAEIIEQQLDRLGDESRELAGQHLEMLAGMVNDLPGDESDDDLNLRLQKSILDFATETLLDADLSDPERIDPDCQELRREALALVREALDPAPDDD